MSNISLSRRNLFKSGGALAVGGAATTLTGSLAHAEGHAAIPRRPIVNTANLGDFKVTSIFDGSVVFDGPYPVFGGNAGEEAVKALAAENFLSTTQMEIGFTPIIVETGSETILFDAGNGIGRRPNAGALLERMKLVGMDPAAVSIVVITHMHPDHIGGLMEDGEPAFPNARYVTASAEYDFWSSEDRVGSPAEGVHKLVKSNVVPLAEKMTFIKGGEDVVSGITAVDASGHTPGHMAYNIESDGKRLMLCADFANHYVVALQKPDWHVRFDLDKDAAVATRKKLLGMIAADKIPFTGYHMPFPSVGYLEAKDEGYRYVAASYQMYL